MHSHKKITVVIPCFNEEGGLRRLLSDMPDFVDEVLVIDNQSTDKTVSVAHNFGATVIRLGVRQYGFSYHTGFLQASGDIIVTIDGDASYFASDIVRLLNFMKEGNYDFVIGSRFPLSSKGIMPWHKRYANYFIFWLARIVFSVSINDTQSGMMALTRTCLPLILSEHKGMAFSHEIKLHALLNTNINCGELKIEYAQRVGSVKFRYFSDTVRNLASFARCYIFFKILNCPQALLLNRVTVPLAKVFNPLGGSE